MMRRPLLAIALIAGVVAAASLSTTAAGPLRERVASRHPATSPQARSPLPPGTVVARDIAYGADPLQRLDVYAPANAHGAPVIVMVHGGGWKRGDKAMRSVIENKVARWVPRGVIVISTNYRFIPETPPLEQARDVARALAHVQAHAARWGGDGTRAVLMGHSAGAHLVSLLTADPALARNEGARDWLGTVALDSGAFDVPAIMNSPHPPLYDDAFGADPADWRAASPLHVLRRHGPPLLAVCSTERRGACPQARAYELRARALHRRADVLPQPLGHRAINDRLGTPGAYTDAVERFLRTLDPVLAQRLAD